MKKIIVILVLLLMTCGFIFAGGGQESKSSGKATYKMGYAIMDLGNPYFVALSNGVKDRAKELGIEMTVSDAKLDANNQINAIENFIAQKMDAIIISPVDPKGIAPLIKSARENGIKVVNGNQQIEGAKVDAFMNIVEYDYGLTGGLAAGEWIKETFGDEAVEVAILDLPEVEPVIARANGIRDGILKIAPNAKIVANQSAAAPDTGMRAMETILQAFPNVKVVQCVNDGGALGALEAIKAAGKADDTFYLGGLDATDEAIAKMKEPGSIYRFTADIDPYGTGKSFVDLAVQVIKEGPIDEMVKVKIIPVHQDDL